MAASTDVTGLFSSSLSSSPAVMDISNTPDLGTSFVDMTPTVSLGFVSEWPSDALPSSLSEAGRTPNIMTDTLRIKEMHHSTANTSFTRTLQEITPTIVSTFAKTSLYVNRSGLTDSADITSVSSRAQPPQLETSVFTTEINVSVIKTSMSVIGSSLSASESQSTTAFFQLTDGESIVQPSSAVVKSQFSDKSVLSTGVVFPSFSGIHLTSSSFSQENHLSTKTGDLKSVTDVLKSQSDILSSSSAELSSDFTKTLVPLAPTTSRFVPTTSATVPTGIGTTYKTKNNNKTTETQPGPGPADFPNESLLFIIVPVCVIAVLVLAIILVVCLRRRKLAKKQYSKETSQDLWVNTRTTNLSLGAPNSTSTDMTANGSVSFKPGDTLCWVLHPFPGQLEGQMALKEGEIIKILEKADHGWWRGQAKAEIRTGWFPGSYVKEIKPETSITENVDEDGAGGQRMKSRVSSFMLKKRERHRKKSLPSKHADSECEQETSLSKEVTTGSPEISCLETKDLIMTIEPGTRFVSVFAYKAAFKGELNLMEGETLIGYEKDRNGWMRGMKESTGEEGWFPAVYVDEISSDAVSLSGDSTLSGPVTYDQLVANRSRRSDQEWLGIEHRAVFPYSSEVVEDLSFSIGDIIIVYETLENGWWLGSCGDSVGWFPGSYLEMLDTGRDDDSKSDVSSVLSTYEDTSKAGEEDHLDVLSVVSSASTLSDQKPKPARKAPAPPKPKQEPTENGTSGPIKEPEEDITCVVRENDGISQPVTESENITSPTMKKEEEHITLPVSPVEQKISESINKKEEETVSRPIKPARPAPAPPTRKTDPEGDFKANYLHLGSSDTSKQTNSKPVSANRAGSADRKAHQRKKPEVPKRFAKPKVIKYPRRSSQLQNLAVNSRPSSRPVPPRPPPPKFNNQSGGRKLSGHQAPTSSLSGIYAKKSTSRLPGRSAAVVTGQQIEMSESAFSPAASPSHDMPRFNLKSISPNSVQTVQPDLLPAAAQSVPGTGFNQKTLPGRKPNSPVRVGPPVLPRLSSFQPEKNDTTIELPPEGTDRKVLHIVKELDRISSNQTISNKEKTPPQIVPKELNWQNGYDSLSGTLLSPKATDLTPSPVSSDGEREKTPDRNEQVTPNSPLQLSSGDKTDNKRQYSPPVRPPPPKSPPPKSQRMVSQDESQMKSKSKKKTLRRAVQSYTATGKGELSFEEGSFIKEISEATGHPGWCVGMLADGTTGLFPKSHVKESFADWQTEV